MLFCHCELPAVVLPPPVRRVMLPYSLFVRISSRAPASRPSTQSPASECRTSLWIPYYHLLHVWFFDMSESFSTKLLLQTLIILSGINDNLIPDFKKTNWILAINSIPFTLNTIRSCMFKQFLVFYGFPAKFSPPPHSNTILF